MKDFPLSRRAVVGSMLAAGLAEPLASAVFEASVLPVSRSWGPPPPPVQTRSGLTDLPGVKLWYWDTLGAGEPVIFLHPGTGSGLIWGYQQAAFAQAGYRVIGYSRRGHAKSQSGDPDNPGTGADDLANLADALGIERFHLVGSAAGGFIVPDFALSFPERLITMTLACTQGGVIEPDYRARIAMLYPEGYFSMPESFRELSPTYRVAYPEGAHEWEELEKKSQSGPRRIAQASKNQLTWAAVETIATPSLIFTGAADLYMPPPLMLEYASHLANKEVAIISEAGHSVYWEQPAAFNGLILDFLSRHRGG